MLSKTHSIAAVAAVTIVSVAGTAHAAFMSFASDSADRAWTFTGSGSSFTANSLGGSANPIILNIDDNNGPQPTLQFSCAFTSTTTIAFAGDVTVGGAISHNYTASGSYSFTDLATNTTIFSVTYSGLLFTARGGSGTWLTTAALQGDNTGGSVTMTWSGANLPNYGLANNATYHGGFSFALDAINTSGVIPYGGQNPGASLTNNLPNATWFSEASFTATTVPTPAGLSLLALSGALGTRRRRR
jgi:MYXO-CTERM domain-containing protein